LRVVVTVLVVLLAGAVGAEQAERGYELKLEPGAVDTRPGGAGAVSVTIAPQPGYSIDRDGPLRIQVEIAGGDGVELPRTRYRRADAADARADAPRFDLRYKAIAVGSYELHIDAHFWVCRRYTCRDAHEVRTVPIRVSEPPESEPPADAAPPQ